MSRVFLAGDLSLGGKQVVLKVTLDRGQEPKVQGSLDHPHIVPGQFGRLSDRRRALRVVDALPAGAAAGQADQADLSGIARHARRLRSGTALVEPSRATPAATQGDAGRDRRALRRATAGKGFPSTGPTRKAWPGSS